MLGRPYHLDPGLNHDVLDEFQVKGYPVLSIRSLPKDEEYLNKLYKKDLESGKISNPYEINDVWPENYSANSSQKVWAAKFAAHHPNVAVLDLSSFKCGHDSPTYGLIDKIIGTSNTPYSALHDIDANKPGGSIKIRVKTYTHSLSLREEMMDDVKKRQDELHKRIEAKKAELLKEAGITKPKPEIQELPMEEEEETPLPTTQNDYQEEKETAYVAKPNE